MKTIFTVICGLVMLLSAAACQANQTQNIPATITTLETGVSPKADTTTPTAEPQIDLGYTPHEPAFLPEGYVLETTTVDEKTRSICLEYRHRDDPAGVLLIAQGPAELAPQLEVIDEWPEYSFRRTPWQIGGAKRGYLLSGWRRKAWACSELAENEKTPYSFALAPRYTWTADNLRFDLFSASAGCANPGGLTNQDLQRVAEGLTGQTTLAADELDPDCLHSAADAEKLAGFDVKEPAYLPENIAFYYATVEKTAGPLVTLYYYHTQHTSGPFFNIIQQKKPSPVYTATCDAAADKTCETLMAAEIPVVYQFLDPTEELDWFDGISYFTLFRNAGEPGKVYKDELLKVVESMK